MVRYEENPVMFVQFCASKTVWLFLSLLLTSFMLIFFVFLFTMEVLCDMPAWMS